MRYRISKNNLEVIKNRYFFAKKFVDNKSILEIGCGFGLGFEYLYQNSKDYIGTDINEEQINLAKKNNSMYENKFLMLKLKEIKKLNQKFDIIICLATVYYLDINEFLDVSKKILNQNGQIVFDMSNKDMPGFDSKWDNQSKYYQVDELNSILKENGFSANFYGSYEIGNQKKISTILKIRSIVKKLFNFLKLNFLKKIIIFFVDKNFYILPHSIKDDMESYNYNYRPISPLEKCLNYKVIFVEAKSDT